MIHISSKTAAILAAFTAVSAPLMLAGCGQEAPKGEALTDENGRTYISSRMRMAQRRRSMIMGTRSHSAVTRMIT